MTDPRAPRPGDISRRRFLQGSALAGTAAFLAACGTPGRASEAPSAAASAAASEGASPAASASAGAGATPANSGNLRFANWIGYIDQTEDGKTFPTIEKFQTESGISVQYSDGVIDGNESFFTSDLQAPLNAGLPTEWDIVVVTDWMVGRLARLGWLEKIDTSATPNFVKNLAENYKGRSFDPDTNMAAPWQSGMTGIGYDKNKTGAQDSLSVFVSDKFKGKLTYLDEMRDTVGLTRDPARLRPGDDHPGTVRRVARRGRQGGQERHRPRGRRQLLCRGHGRRRGGARDGLVRRRPDAARAGPEARPGLPVEPRQGRRDALDRQHGHPERLAEQAAGRALDRLLLRPEERRHDRGVRQLRLPGRGRQGGHARHRRIARRTTR